MVEDDPNRLSSQHVIAMAYEANGQVKEAMELLKHVVAIRECAGRHPDRFSSQHELAKAYEANGQVKIAIELLEHVVAMDRRMLVEDHLDRLVSE